MSIRRTFHWINAASTVVAALATVAIFCVSTAQWSAFRDQLTLAYHPRLNANHFHIWEKGHGKPFERPNVPPPFIHGTPISGALLAVNDGREDAFVVGGGCLAHWQKEPRLPMNSPLRPDNPDLKPLKYMDDLNIYQFKDGPVYKVVPGQFFGC
jgi:hypothetical protein